MVSADQQTTAPAAGAADRFRHAERALWTSYGLEPSERFIELPEPRVRVRVQETGTGDPVVFIGGSAGTGAYWAPLIRELPGRRAIVLDRPGWALSSPIDYRGTNLGDVAATIIRGVLDELGLGRVDIVGQSIGGTWALHGARADGDRIGALCSSEACRIPRSRCRRSSNCCGRPSARSWPGPRCGRACSTSSWRRLDTARPLRAAACRTSWPGDWTSSATRRRCATSAPWCRRSRHGMGFAPVSTSTRARWPTSAQPTLMVFGTADPGGHLGALAPLRRAPPRRSPRACRGCRAQRVLGRPGRCGRHHATVPGAIALPGAAVLAWAMR